MLSSEGVFPALMGIYNYIQCFMNLKGPLFVHTNIFIADTSCSPRFLSGFKHAI